MTDNLCLRISLFQILQEEVEGGFLFGCTSIGVATFVIHASNVADANGMLVVVPDMRAGILLGSTLMDAAILVDDPMVAAHGPVLGTVPSVDVINGYALADSRTATVHDEVQDLLHWFHFLHTVQSIEVTQLVTIADPASVANSMERNLKIGFHGNFLSIVMNLFV